MRHFRGRIRSLLHCGKEQPERSIEKSYPVESKYLWCVKMGECPVVLTNSYVEKLLVYHH